MNRFSKTVALLGFLLIPVLSAHAQSGCTNSPENPTALLGVVGTGGLLIARYRGRIQSYVQTRLRRQK